ncbi:MAG: GNAT family N-acetyltransferase [Verrucomicrobiota bacterium]
MELETPRLRLRWFRLSDLDAMAQVLGHPEVMRFSLSGPYDRAKTQRFLEGCQIAYEERRTGLYAVVVKETDAVIGYCGFYYQMVDYQEEVEIGYRLHPDYWSRGLATEAAAAIQDHGQRDFGYQRMISIIEAENVASIRVAEKCGLSFEKNSSFKGIPVRIYAVTKG